MREYKKRARKLVKYILSELERVKSNNITLDCGRYLNKRELNYINSLGIFKEVKNSMFGCMVYFLKEDIKCPIIKHTLKQ